MTKLRCFFSDDDAGQSLVEFALMLPIVLLIITGLFDVGRAVWQENTLAYAAREGTRYAIVHGSSYPVESERAYSGNTAGVAQVVRNAAVGVGGTITVVAKWPTRETSPGAGDGCSSRACSVSVVASAAFIPLPSQYMLGGAFQITLKGGSQLVIQR